MMVDYSNRIQPSTRLNTNSHPTNKTKNGVSLTVTTKMIGSGQYLIQFQISLMPFHFQNWTICFILISLGLFGGMGEYMVIDSGNVYLCSLHTVIADG